MKKIFRHWKIIYAVCCLVYVGWMIHVGGNEFDRINGQYQRLVRQLEPGLIRSAAVAELASECRSESRQRTVLEEDCSTWASQLVEARMKEVEERHLLAKQRGTVKRVLFYTGFVVIFLLGPVVLIYLLIVAVILLYKNIKIVR